MVKYATQNDRVNFIRQLFWRYFVKMSSHGLFDLGLINREFVQYRSRFRSAAKYQSFILTFQSWPRQSFARNFNLVSKHKTNNDYINGSTNPQNQPFSIIQMFLPMRHAILLQKITLSHQETGNQEMNRSINVIPRTNIACQSCGGVWPKRSQFWE